MTGPSTKKAGSAKLPQACASRLIQYQGRIASSCQPSARSARNDPGAGSGRGGTRSSARQARLAKKEAASAANSQPGPNTAMRIPPAAGPPTLKKLCGSPSRLLACCSCSVGTAGRRPPPDLASAASARRSSLQARFLRGRPRVILSHLAPGRKSLTGGWAW
jgi:hypothetical protein